MEKSRANSEPTVCHESPVFHRMAPAGAQVKVVVRVRPQLAHEKGQSTDLLQLEDQCITLHQPRGDEQRHQGSSKRFAFHEVFREDAQQDDIAARLLPELVESVANGFNGTIFAYGQTGSGKSYTMDGHEYSTRKGAGRIRVEAKAALAEERLGITPRAIQQVFERVRASPERRATVRCSFLQIYNEQLFDLLDPNAAGLHQAAQQQQTQGRSTGFRGGLKLRWSQASEFYVDHLTSPECQDAEEALRLYRQGVQCKIMASHGMNAASSRSHCLFTLYVEQQQPPPVAGQEEDGDLCAASGMEADEAGVVRSQLTLVDLAGSERVASTGATGRTLVESIGINKSLFTLRQVIQSLAEGGQAPPYREAKLTSLLKHALGGNSHTVMVACLSPNDLFASENLNTLTYAARAQSIVNSPTLNLDSRSQLIASLRAQNAQLKAELKQTQAALLALQTAIQEGRDPTSLLPPASRQAEGVPAGEAAAAPPVAPRVPEPARPGQGASEAAGEGVQLSKTQLRQELVESARLVKLLVEGERRLMESQAQLETDLQRAKGENGLLQDENRELRERLELLEFLVATSTGADGSQPSAATFAVPGIGPQGMALVQPPASSPAADRDQLSPDEDQGGVADASMMQQQIARLQYQNGLLQEELQQLRQASLAALPTPGSRQRATSSSVDRNQRSAGLADTQKRAGLAKKPVRRLSSGGRLGALTPDDMRTATEEHGSSSSGKRRGHAASAGGGRHAGVLSLGDLKSLLKGGGGSGNASRAGSHQRHFSAEQAGSVSAGGELGPLHLRAFHEAFEGDGRPAHEDRGPQQTRSSTTGGAPHLLHPAGSEDPLPAARVTRSEQAGQRAEEAWRKRQQLVDLRASQEQALQSLNSSLRRALMRRKGEKEEAEAAVAEELETEESGAMVEVEEEAGGREPGWRG